MVKVVTSMRICLLMYRAFQLDLAAQNLWRTPDPPPGCVHTQVCVAALVGSP